MVLVPWLLGGGRLQSITDSTKENWNGFFSVQNCTAVSGVNITNSNTNSNTKNDERFETTKGLPAASGLWKCPRGALSAKRMPTASTQTQCGTGKDMRGAGTRNASPSIGTFARAAKNDS